MKKTLKRLISSPVSVIARVCFVMWIFGVADHTCSATDEREQGEERALVKMEIPIPLVAQGHEKIYRRFLNGVLIYRPNGDGNDVGMVKLFIRDLANPLEGTFDLSRCGDTGKYLNISTGYRKGKRPENASKIEIWFAPRFLIEKELKTTAKHFEPIYGNWKEQAEVGMFWTWGGNDDLSSYDYLTTENINNLSKINLYENWKKSPLLVFRRSWHDGPAHRICARFSCSFCELK